MVPAKTLLAQDFPSLCKKAAQIFLEASADAVRTKGVATIAVSGGSTPKGLFELLAESLYASRVNWSKTHLFWVDERCVPPQHADSNYGMTHATLLSRVPISPSNVHRMAGEMSSPQQAAKAYENELKSFFKLTLSPPEFDLIFLGLGEDGHTASLFPKSEALHDLDHWVAANFVEKFSAHRITLTLPVLNNAKKVVFLVSGNSKAQVLQQIFTDDSGSKRFPAQLIEPRLGDLTWLFDKDAASKLPNEVRYQAFHL